ncbi:MAG: hypothetical protein ABI439_09850, partial [Rhodospirillales bacterium]
TASCQPPPASRLLPAASCQPSSGRSLVLRQRRAFRFDHVVPIGYLVATHYAGGADNRSGLELSMVPYAQAAAFNCSVFHAVLIACAWPRLASRPTIGHSFDMGIARILFIGLFLVASTFGARAMPIVELSVAHHTMAAENTSPHCQPGWQDICDSFHVDCAQACSALPALLPPLAQRLRIEGRTFAWASLSYRTTSVHIQPEPYPPRP